MSLRHRVGAIALTATAALGLGTVVAPAAQASTMVRVTATTESQCWSKLNSQIRLFQQEGYHKVSGATCIKSTGWVGVVYMSK